jgi:hypothetical protein
VYYAIHYQKVMAGSIPFIIVVGHDGEMQAIRTKVNVGLLTHGAEFVVGAIFRAIANDVRPPHSGRHDVPRRRNAASCR